jgi:tetratricopeptide (TPR) repeat protein
MLGKRTKHNYYFLLNPYLIFKHSITRKTMRKTGLLFLALALTISSIAQNVTSAYNANKSGEYDKAVGYIEEAIKNPKDAGKEKTWRYRGNIYYNIANGSKWADQFPNAITLAKESYFKALEIEPVGGYSDETKAGLIELQKLVLLQASTQYNAKDYSKAGDGFVTASDISTKFAFQDSVAYFNAANAYDLSGRKDEALVYYKKAAELGYNIPDVYVYMADLLNAQGKKEESDKLVSDARAKYPDNAELLRLEVNRMLTDKNYAEAEKLLLALTEKNPKNEMFWIVLGSTYEKLEKSADAEGAYKKALELNPNNFDCLYNLGALSYNNGANYFKAECEKIPNSQRAKYDECVGKCQVHFKQAVTYLEKAHAINPNDADLMVSLKEAYIRTENEEGILRMSKMIKEAQGK